MLFNSYIFVLCFLPIAVIGYFMLNYFQATKLAMGFLILMSCWFYGYNNPAYLGLLVSSILVNYSVTYGMGKLSGQVEQLIIEESKEKKLRFLLLLIALFFNLGMLFYFKYYDFFVSNFNELLKTEFVLLELMLPLGISFYTFQQISYVVDCYKREVKPYSFLSYATYVSFFPQLIAGPIVLHSEMIPQFMDKTNKKVNYENLTKGMYAFSLGLAKKVLIADNLSMVSYWGFANYMHIDATNTAISMLCFTLQLYFDFSGYCDMAQGIGYLFNIKIPDNFNSPYKATSIADFWTRWHMTLTRFFTKYLYIPLGGNRKGKMRTYINIMIVFFVSGFWHGAAWNYVVWGVLNGGCLVIYRMVKGYFSKVPRIIATVFSFILTNLLFCFFRVKAVVYGFEMVWTVFTGAWGEVESGICTLINTTTEIRILSRLGLENFITQYPGVPLLVFLGCATAGVLFMKNTQEKVENFKPTYCKMIIFSVLLTWSVISFGEISEFLYFNF